MRKCKQCRWSYFGFRMARQQKKGIGDWNWKLNFSILQILSYVSLIFWRWRKTFFGIKLHRSYIFSAQKRKLRPLIHSPLHICDFKKEKGNNSFHVYVLYLLATHWKGVVFAMKFMTSYISKFSVYRYAWIVWEKLNKCAYFYAFGCASNWSKVYMFYLLGYC